MHKSKGFTLIELLVYIVIAAIIVGLAGQAFLDATRSRLRTTRMLESSMGTADVMAYLQDDIRRTGMKASIEPTSSSSTSSSAGVGVLSDVYIAPTATTKDSSSFIATTSGTAPNRLDEIEFRTATYNPTTQLVTGWEQIRYSVDGNGVLWRTTIARKTKAGVDITPLPDPVRMAENVVAFQLRYGVQANDSIIFSRNLNQPCATTVPVSSCLAQHTATTATLTANGNLPKVGDLPEGTEVLYKMMQGAATTSVDQFAIVAGNTYRVVFGLGSNDSAAANFRPDSDYVAMRVTPHDNPSTHIAGTTDVLFYSALDEDIADRSFEFTPSVSGSASLALKFQMRVAPASGTSRMHSAAFTMNKVVVKAMANDAYEWKDSFTTSATDLRLKRRVRAIEMSISIMVNTSVSTSKKVIPVVNNGV